MKTESEEIDLPQQWADDLEAGDLPDSIAAAKAHGNLPGKLGKLAIRLGVREWPDGEQKHIKARLQDTLGEVLAKGAEAVGMPLLPPSPAEPFDVLRSRAKGTWSEPLDLNTPLWLALASGHSRRFGIEYKLAVQINAKWAVVDQPALSPRQLLTAFGFDPAEFSLYPANSAQLLPADEPLNLKRGDRFEAQKDGKYGFRPAPPRGLQTLEQDVEALKGVGVNARITSASGQTYVEVGELEVPSPPWSGSKANILVAVPSTYPNGGLDAFYLEPTVNQGGSIPRQQSSITIDGRTWTLISWHYADRHPWNPSRDDLASHIAHCRGFFLQRGVR